MRIDKSDIKVGMRIEGGAHPVDRAWETAVVPPVRYGSRLPPRPLPQPPSLTDIAKRIDAARNKLEALAAQARANK